MERRNPARQFMFARDQLICGPAGKYAADVLSTIGEHPVDAVLVETAVAGALIGAEASRRAADSRPDAQHLPAAH